MMQSENPKKIFKKVDGREPPPGMGISEAVGKEKG